MGIGIPIEDDSPVMDSLPFLWAQKINVPETKKVLGETIGAQFT